LIDYSKHSWYIASVEKKTDRLEGTSLVKELSELVKKSKVNKDKNDGDWSNANDNPRNERY
jgi:hypothetical protein